MYCLLTVSNCSLVVFNVYTCSEHTSSINQSKHQLTNTNLAV